MIVYRSYDSDEIEDHGFYLVWKFFDFDHNEGLLSTLSIQKIEAVIHRAKEINY